MSRSLLAKIHVAKKELGLDQEVYRALLRRVTGKSSSGEMTAAEREAVIAEFKRLGWKPKAPAKPGAGWRPTARRAHHRKVYALWGELKRRGIWREDGHRSLDALCRRLTRVETVEFMTAEQSATVIAALQAMRDDPPKAA